MIAVPFFARLDYSTGHALWPIGRKQSFTAKLKCHVLLVAMM
jgi:hypothetical protein